MPVHPRIVRFSMGAAASISAALLIGSGTLAQAAPADAPVAASPAAGARVAPAQSAPGDDAGISARAAVTYLVECIPDSLVKTPTTFVLACADANERLEGLTWSDWGADQARAEGEVVTNSCEPDCAHGNELRSRVKVTARDLAQGEATATYRTLVVTAVGDHPAGTAESVTYSLPGVDPNGPDTMADPTPAPRR